MIELSGSERLGFRLEDNWRRDWRQFSLAYSRNDPLPIQTAPYQDSTSNSQADELRELMPRVGFFKGWRFHGTALLFVGATTAAHCAASQG
jgi:hypothetical protein